MELNPKKAFGDKKPRLSLAPMTATLKQVEAQLDGALKYGEVNWRKNAVEAKTYIDAAMRHLRLYENGEELARDTQVHNLGGVMACCAILIDAEAHGKLIDNRSHSPETCDALHAAEAMVVHLKAKQDERDRVKQKQQFQNVPSDADAHSRQCPITSVVCHACPPGEPCRAQYTGTRAPDWVKEQIQPDYPLEVGQIIPQPYYHSATGE